MYDIRNGEFSEILQIRFADEAFNEDGESCGNATTLFRMSGGVCLSDEDGDLTMRIETEDDAKNLISTLQYAMNMQWWG